MAIGILRCSIAKPAFQLRQQACCFQRLCDVSVHAGVQAFCMVAETPGWIFVQIGALALIFAINARPIIAGVLQVLRRRAQ